MVEPITLIAIWGLSYTAKFIYQSVLAELKDDLETLPWLKQRAQSDDHYFLLLRC